MRITAFFCAPAAGILILFSGIFYFDKGSNNEYFFSVIAVWYLIALMVQLLAELIMFLLSKWISTNVKVYYILSLIPCFILGMLISSRNGDLSIDKFTGYFLLIFTYTSVNVFCYYHLYFKQQIADEKA